MHQPLDILAFERNVQTIALVLNLNGTCMRPKNAFDSIVQQINY